jgi:hypothetical protein
MSIAWWHCLLIPGTVPERGRPSLASVATDPARAGGGGELGVIVDGRSPRGDGRGVGGVAHGELIMQRDISRQPQR